MVNEAQETTGRMRAATRSELCGHMGFMTLNRVLHLFVNSVNNFPNYIVFVLIKIFDFHSLVIKRLQINLFAFC